MTRRRLQLAQEYDPRSVEKVERLLELLAALARNPFLEKRLVLHGGTALNLFHLPRVVRLSVDIDLLYVGGVSREEMLQERDEVVGQLFAEARLLGYQVGTPKEDHAGITSRMNYRTRRDQIKVDLNSLDRVPVRGWATAWARPTLGAEVAFRCMQPSELAARKICALFGRIAVRDLYDLQYWRSFVESPGFPALAVYYYSLADSFPQRPLDSTVLDRFLSRQAEVERDLYPMLASTERPTVEELVSRVSPLLTLLSELDPEHREYLRLLAQENDYRPELLFRDSPEALEAARVSPRMEWKLHNLRSRTT